VFADRAKRNWPSSPFVLWKDIRQQSSGRDKQKTQREPGHRQTGISLQLELSQSCPQHATCRGKDVVVASSRPGSASPRRFPHILEGQPGAVLAISLPFPRLLFAWAAAQQNVAKASNQFLKWLKFRFKISIFLAPFVVLFSLLFFASFFFAQPFGVLCHVWFFCVWFSSAVLKFEHLYSGHCQVPSRGLFETAVFVTLVVVMYRMFNMSTFIYLCLGHLYPLFQMDLAESTPPFWPKAIGHHIACIWLTKRTLYNRKFF